MAVRIRLKRLGRRNRAFWRICATDKRSARDGRVIEELGWYDPHLPNPEMVRIDRDRVSHWLKAGATPSETVERLLLHVGIDAKGEETRPHPWKKKRPVGPPPPAAQRVEEAKAAEAAEASVEAPVSESEAPEAAEAEAPPAPPAPEKPVESEPPAETAEVPAEEPEKAAEETAEVPAEEPEEAAEEASAEAPETPEEGAGEPEKPQEGAPA